MMCITQYNHNTIFQKLYFQKNYIYSRKNGPYSVAFIHTDHNISRNIGILAIILYEAKKDLKNT